MRRVGTMGKILLSIIGIVVILLLIVVVTAVLLEDRLRAYAEQEVNSRVTDYEVRIGKLALHPLALSVDLSDVTVRQKRQPDPPLLLLAEAKTGLRWSGLLRGRLLADVVLEAPRVQVSRPQSSEVHKDVREHAPTAEEQQAWQDRVLALVPVELTVALRDGAVTYREKGQAVVSLTQLQFLAGPIRNVKAEPGTYPSPIRLQGRINQGAEVDVQGYMDAFAKPHAAGKVDVALHHLDLPPLQPVADRYHLKLYQGQLSLEGRVEYAPWVKEYTLRDLTLEKVMANYIYKPEAPKPEKHAVKKGAEKTKEAAEQPETIIRADRVKIADSEFGVVHAGVDPPYRIFVDHTFVDMKNFSNRLTDKAAELSLKGRFMASGDLEGRGLFRPDTKAPDFDLSIRLEHTQVKMLNDLLRAHGRVDVAGGEFFVYSQFNVKHGQIRGYVKPIIRELDVYNADQERGKGVTQKLYEGIVGGATELLENRDTELAGTKVEVSGTIKNAQIDAWHAAMQLIQNAFFQLIVPRFERPVRPTKTAVLTVE